MCLRQFAGIYSDVFYKRGCIYAALFVYENGVWMSKVNEAHEYTLCELSFLLDDGQHY